MVELLACAWENLLRSALLKAELAARRHLREVPPMNQQAARASLQVRLGFEAWEELKRRASSRSPSIGSYAESVFRYTLHFGRRQPSGSSTPRRAEAIYGQLHISERLKMQLRDSGEASHQSLADFSGELLEQFFSLHVQDPRDLLMIDFLSFRLEERAVLSEEDLARAISLCDRTAGVRLPPGYLAKWLHSRVQPWLPRVDRQGALVPVTVELIERLLGTASIPAQSPPLTGSPAG